MACSRGYFRGYIRIMEKKRKLLYHRIGYILGIYWDNGKEN